MDHRLSGKRIFITEDNSMNRVIYTMALKVSGATLDFDRFGKETLLKLRGFKPDLIILDLMLPGGQTGFDIFTEIRQFPEFEQIPIVAISASDPTFAVPRCQMLGFAGFIAKPIDENLLLDQLGRLIEGEQVWYMGERYGGESKDPKKP